MSQLNKLISTSQLLASKTSKAKCCIQPLFASKDLVRLCIKMGLVNANLKSVPQKCHLESAPVNHSKEHLNAQFV